MASLSTLPGYSVRRMEHCNDRAVKHHNARTSAERRLIEMEAAPAGYRIGEHFSAAGTEATFGSRSESDSASAFARAQSGTHTCGSKCNWAHGEASVRGGGGAGPADITSTAAEYGGGGAAAAAAASAGSSLASIPEPNAAFAATYTISSERETARSQAQAQSHWFAYTDAGARRAATVEAHSVGAVKTATQAAAAARPLEVELAQVRTDTLRDELAESKGIIKAYDTRTYTAEEQLAERAAVILTLNAKADALTASIANIKQECSRKVNALEYASANRVKAAEAYAANRIETALLRMKAEASVSEAKLHRRLVAEAEKSQAEALRNLRFQLNGEHRAEVERIEQALGRQMGDAVHEFHQNTRNMQRKMKSAEEKCAKEVETVKMQAQMDTTQAAERAIAQERSRPGGINSPSRTAKHAAVRAPGPSERQVLNDMQQRLRDLERTVIVSDDSKRGGGGEPTVNGESYQCGNCNRQYESMSAAMQCRYARVSGGCHGNPAGFKGRVGPSSVSDYLQSDMPAERNDNPEKIQRLEEVAALSVSAAGRDGIIRHSADGLGSNRWYKPPRTQTAPMYISRNADRVGTIPN